MSEFDKIIGYKDVKAELRRSRILSGGEFNGGERVLLLLSYYLKGDINEETLVKACELIKKQKSLKSDVGSLNLLDEWIENLGLKK